VIRHFAIEKSPKQHGQGKKKFNSQKKSSHLEEFRVEMIFFEIAKIFGGFG
jgi:hypothetical protein